MMVNDQVNISINLKKKFYKTAVRPVLIYELVCWAVKKKEHNIYVAKMRIFGTKLI